MLRFTQYFRRSRSANPRIPRTRFAGSTGIYDHDVARLATEISAIAAHR